MTDYDQTLLASAPSISRKQKQESYNIALLHPAPTPPSPIESAPLTLYRPSSPHATHPSKEAYYPDRTSSTRQPWYRRKKIWIAGGVGLVVVVGAIVGGAVGGTVGRHGKNQSALAGGSEGSSSVDMSVRPSASVPQPVPTPTATPDPPLSNVPGSETFEPTGTDTRGVSPSSAGGGQPIDISTSSPGDSDTAFPTETESDSGGVGVRPSDSGVVSGVPVGDPTTTSTHRSHTRNTMFRGTVGGTFTPTATPEGGDPIQEDPVQTDV